jgi:hypothetical protein
MAGTQQTILGMGGLLADLPEEGDIVIVPPLRSLMADH